MWPFCTDLGTKYLGHYKFFGRNIKIKSGRNITRRVLHGFGKGVSSAKSGVYAEYMAGSMIPKKIMEIIEVFHICL